MWSKPALTEPSGEKPKFTVLETAVVPVYAGVAKVVNVVVGGLTARGHEVGLWLCQPNHTGRHGNGALRGQESDSPTVRVVPAFLLAGRFVPFGVFRLCRQHLRTFQLIHINGYRNLLGVIVSAHARWWRIPYVFTAHGVLHAEARLGMWQFLRKRIYENLAGNTMVRGATMVTAISESEVRLYRRIGVPREKIRVIYNPIDPKEFSQLPARGQFRQERGLQERKLILYLGQVIRRKGIDHLIDAFGLLAPSMDAALIIVGPDPEGYRARLQKQANRLGVHRKVLFLDSVRGLRKLETLVDADVVVYGASFEDFGLVAFEALMCGTPVIVSRGTGCGDLVERADAGYTVPYGRPDELATTLAYILEHPEEAAEKVRHGQAFIQQHFSPSRIVVQWEALFTECLHLRQAESKNE